MLLHDILTAATTPHAPALHCQGTTLDFATLDVASRRLADLVTERTTTGARVAILAHNRPEYVLAYYGVPRAGRVLAPLNQRLHPREWTDQIRRAEVELVLAEPELLRRLRNDGGWHGPALRLVDEPDQTDARAAADVTATSARPTDPNPRDAAVDDGTVDLVLARLVGDVATSDERASSAESPGPSPDDTAWLLFTSGSTGRPKGVRLTHRSLLAAMRTTLQGRPVADDTVFLTPFPLCHVAGYQVLMHHLVGRAAVVMRSFDPTRLTEAVEQHAVTALSLAPTMLDALLEHLRGAGPQATRSLRRRVRSIGYGASPIGAELLRRTVDMLDCDLNQGYGMTELSGNAVFLGPDEHRLAASGERPELLAAAGRPVAGVQLRMVDDTGAEVTTGQLGEITVRAEQVAAGYWQDEQATEDGFGGGWLRTGDLGRLDADGYLYVVDRTKDVIVSGGENVGSREVEAVLARHPSVRAVAVIGVPHPRWGEQVCAVVVADGPTEQDALTPELLAACRAELAGFKVPRVVHFTDDLPLTGSGKVSKAVLRERYAATRSEPVPPPGGGAAP